MLMRIVIWDCFEIVPYTEKFWLIWANSYLAPWACPGKPINHVGKNIRSPRQVYSSRLTNLEVTAWARLPSRENHLWSWSSQLRQGLGNRSQKIRRLSRIKKACARLPLRENQLWSRSIQLGQGLGNRSQKIG